MGASSRTRSRDDEAVRSVSRFLSFAGGSNLTVTAIILSAVKITAPKA